MERVRDLSGDPAGMLALAHPTRLSLLELLGQHGPLTATQAGQQLGESPGTMSWHLQVLARHGFVTEAEGGKGRRRPWQLVASGTRVDPEPKSEEERAAAEVLMSMAAERAFGRLRAWLASRYLAPGEWKRAAAVSDWTLYLTAAETQQLRDQIYALLEQYTDRLLHPSSRPDGAVAVQALIAVHPQQPTLPEADR